jgi:hypothetical protein
MAWAGAFVRGRARVVGQRRPLRVRALLADSCSGSPRLIVFVRDDWLGESGVCVWGGGGS